MNEPYTRPARTPPLGRRPRTPDPSGGADPATAGDELRLRTRSRGDRRIVELAGRLDRGCCDLLAEALQQAIDAGVEEIVLDLTEVVAIDRAAVLAILLAHLRASDQRAQLVIVPGRRSVQEALEAIQGPFTYADPENIESVRERP